MIKEILLHKIHAILDERIASADKAIESAIESRDNETKSSVGDKYETGRTLMQMEVEKNRALRSKNQLLKNELQKIDPLKKHEQVGFGSLVYTSQNNYFISAALGKIEINDGIFYCISMASPIGKQLFKKKQGTNIELKGEKITINTII